MTRKSAPVPLPPHDFLTVAEVAAYLYVSKTVVYELIGEGALPALRVRRQIRIPQQAFLGWLAEQIGGGGEGGKVC
jgi:excisionase family DNA binding protein